MRPLFLLSLPRSGSTVTQRVLAAHPEVATVAEPWLLFALVPVLRRRFRPGTYPLRELMSPAVRRFCERLPDGEDSYRAAIRGAVMQLYEQASEGEAEWFLDKTPAYALFADELPRFFPDARFVVLWRNPLAVIASMVESTRVGWKILYGAHFSLIESVARLVDFQRAHPDRTVVVRYEDLMRGDERAWRSLTGPLGIEFRGAALTNFRDVPLEDPMGGSDRYDHLSPEPLDTWRATFFNPLRKEWARRYLHWVGRERLALMGYELDALLADLDAVPAGPRGLARDAVSLAAAAVRDAVHARVEVGTRGSVWRTLLSAGGRGDRE